MSAAVNGYRGRWFLPGLAGVYALSALGCCALAATRRARFTDLHVYRLGGAAALHGGSLYRLRFAGLPFTYPPFSAAAFAPLAALPWAAAATVLTVGSALALPAMLYLALRLPPVASLFAARAAWQLALAAGAAAIWLEPVRSTLGYGQINLLLGLGVLYDLSLPDTARRKGAAIGVAAGMKLTPVIFVLYLLLTRRYRAAATASAVLAATIAAGFALLPASAAHFWDLSFLNPGRISPVQNVQNQSLLGAMARTLHTAAVGGWWLPLAIGIAVTGLALAARAQRAGDEAGGFCLCAITGLLISPISWTHHWTLAVPALLLAAISLYRQRAWKRAATALGMAAIAAIAIIGWTGLARDVHDPDWLHLSVVDMASSEVYVVAGLAVLALAGGSFLARRLAETKSRPVTPPATRPGDQAPVGAGVPTGGSRFPAG
jgi:alpha-1,2-mannosyltransferase